jgi:Cellulase (glycosyl hydrolase family 5).
MTGTSFIHSQGRTTHCFSRFALIGFVCLAFFSPSFGVRAKYGQLSVKAGHIVNQYGNVQLRGMSMYGWTNACGYAFYNASCINHLAQDWKCTVIRLPYIPNRFIPMTSINAVIQACIDNGIYVIVDWHVGAGIYASDTAMNFFKTIANQWHTYPNIMYEPWNEPTVGWPLIKPSLETVIAAIRAIDSTNIIICGTSQWDQKPQDAAADPITDYQNIAYSMHFDAASHSVAGYSPGITTAMSKGCAIFITEYGTCNANGSAPINLTATQAWYDFLDKNVISSTNWGVECYDTGGAAAFQKNASTTGPWTDYDLTSGGLFVKAYIAGPGCACMDDFPQSINTPTTKGVLTKAYTKSFAVYTINGVRVPIGGKLPKGLFITQAPRKNLTKCFNIIH